jgi:hypothetical protein
LIPRNLGLESRPFEEEPPCFFEAKRTETSENADCVAREVSGRPARASSERRGGADEGQRRGVVIPRPRGAEAGRAADRGASGGSMRTLRRRRERGGERSAAERLAQALHLPREEE